MAVRLMVIVFILGVGMCGVLFKGRDTVLSLFSENSCGHCTFSSSGFSPKDVEGEKKRLPTAHRWHKDSSQASGHNDELILMPERTLPKLMQYSYPFIIHFNFEVNS